MRREPLYWATWLVTTTACGRIGFDPTVVADARGDIAVDVPLGPFGSPVVIPELASAFEEDDPTMTADQLELYFESSRADAGDIFVSVRAAADLPWSTPARVAEFSSSSIDGCPKVSPDGLVMYLCSDRAGGSGSFDLYVSTRLLRTDPWGPPSALLLNSSAGDVHPAVSASGLEMIFASNRAGGAGGYDLYRSIRASITDAWQSSALVAEVNTPSADVSGCMAAGDRELWISTSASGDDDIVVASRAEPTLSFSSASPVPELNSLAEDADPWVSEDGRTIVFSSNRSGNTEIYIATR